MDFSDRSDGAPGTRDRQAPGDITPGTPERKATDGGIPRQDPQPPPPGQTGAPARHGRNLPVAAGVGLLLGGLVVLTLFTVKATFLVFMGAAAATALWELSQALGSRGIRFPVIPVAAGGAAMWLCEYWWDDRAVLTALVLTAVAVLAWRLPAGTDGYVRDVTAGMFALAYIPLMAVFLVAMLAPADGARRVVSFVIIIVSSDIGGYFAGSLLGRHQMARVISPNKTWEGLAGSVAACLAAGAILVPVLLRGHVWQGLLAGAAAAVAAVGGDLAESAIKRDLKIKDMGSVLPGHGGILDRIDSLLVSAPVVWLVLAALLPGHP